MNQNQYFDQQARTWNDNPQVIERAQLVSGRIAQTIPLQKTMNCLEIGAGTGRIGFLLAPLVGQILLADGSSQMIATAQDRIVETKQSNMSALQFEFGTGACPDESFDLVYSAMAFHHIGDVTGVLASIAKHQAPGGYLSIVDLETEDGSFHAHAPDLPVHHGFDPAWIKQQLEAVGYRVTFQDTIQVMQRPQDDGTVKSYPLFMINGVKA